MRAAIFMGERNLLVGADRSDNAHAQMSGPLASDQSDAAGRRVPKDCHALPHRKCPLQQILRGHTLEHRGSRDLVGTCAVFHGSEQAVFASYLLRLRFDTARANSDYVCWFLNSALGRQQVDSISRQIMQNNINSEEIRTLRVPLPPLEVQRKLVERVIAARAEIARERAAAAALRQTIAAEVEALILGTNILAKK